MEIWIYGWTRFQPNFQSTRTWRIDLEDDDGQVVELHFESVQAAMEAVAQIDKCAADRCTCYNIDDDIPF